MKGFPVNLNSMEHHKHSNAIFSQTGSNMYLVEDNNQKTLRAGVPQDSVLGLPSFLSYFNEIFDIMTTDVRLFGILEPPDSENSQKWQGLIN